jgi:hypothetical protein
VSRAEPAASRAALPILICTGRHCRTFDRKRARLESALAGRAVEIEYVGCQKVCRGPVVGVLLQDEWQWFARMGSEKTVAALTELVDNGRLRDTLRKRRDRRRAGARRP